LKKGTVAIAPKKEEKEQATVFEALKSKKGKKQRKRTDGKDSSFIDFELVKKFNSLKISAPLNEDDLDRTVKDLEDLRRALVYWGKIILRQNKIRFIKSARKIAFEEEF
jgi:hypothetical protein